MKGAWLLILYLWIGLACAQHNNEFFIKGAHVTIQNGAILHVQGDFHLDQGTSGQPGRFNNDGLLELRGDFYIRDNNVEQTDGLAVSLPATSTGTVRFKNRDFSVETTHQDEDQAVICLPGVSHITGSRAFYNLELLNDNNNSAAATDNLIYLDGGDAQVKNVLTFSSDCRLRTHNATPTPSTGEGYSHKLIVSNSDVNAIAGASAVAGDDNRYIEGRLTRGITGTGDYYFPVGLVPGFAGSDGMAAFQLSSVSAAAQRINSYVSINTTTLLVPQIYCDIGDYPDAASGSQPWSNCNGGPDGLYDFAHLNVAASHEWSIENTLTDFTYDLEVFPGPGLDATVASTGGTCGTNDYHLRFLAKDGALMDGSSIGSIIPPPAPFTEYSYPIGYDLCPPDTKQEGNVLTGLSEFSRFRLHGANDLETALPIELVNLEANPIENEYIEVFWRTASEINNDGFELERSMDGVHFEMIAWIDGNGTTLDPVSYRFDDRSVAKGPVYYYRLKQIDLDDTYEYSYVVDAKLRPDGGDMVMYPNPVVDINPVLEVFASNDFVADVLILNSIGQEMRRIDLEFLAGFNSVEIPSEGLAAGTYIVSVLWEGQQFSDKLIILQNK